MPEAKAAPDAKPHQYVASLEQMLMDVATHARQDSSKLSDAKAQALFETAAVGLHKAFDDYEKKKESAWK